MKSWKVSTLTLAALTACAPLLAAQYRISGPYSHDNLSVFLIHGANQAPRHFLTLQEALEQKKVVVYETRNVNELAIENLSDREDVYIQSGDIVKGGQQDRTLKDDIILPTKSGRVSINSFCVEHGRWSGRGNEAVNQFQSARQSVATRELKKAIRISANQAEVWNSVAIAQQQMSDRVGGSVAAPASPSSLMLSLESPRLQKRVDEYLAALSAGPATRGGDVIGVAFAVNGKLSSADVYGSNELFRKLWPKLLQASAVEAISENRAGAQSAVLSFEDVKKLMRNGGTGAVRSRELTPRTKAITLESAQTAVFETRDRANGEALVHKSYLVK